VLAEIGLRVEVELAKLGAPARAGAGRKSHEIGGSTPPAAGSCAVGLGPTSLPTSPVRELSRVDGRMDFTMAERAPRCAAISIVGTSLPRYKLAP
jgi:hypothetical protein